VDVVTPAVCAWASGIHDQRQTVAVVNRPAANGIPSADTAALCRNDFSIALAPSRMQAGQQRALFFYQPSTALLLQGRFVASAPALPCRRRS
jgi:hypothetical protein